MTIFKKMLRPFLVGFSLAPLALSAALASDPDEYTLDPVVPGTTGTYTTTTTTTGN